MVISMDETKLRTIAQLQEFLDATPEVSFSGAAGDGDAQRYEHISCVLRALTTPSAANVIVVWCWLTCATPAATAVPRSPAWWHSGLATAWHKHLLIPHVTHPRLRGDS